MTKTLEINGEPLKSKTRQSWSIGWEGNAKWSLMPIACLTSKLKESTNTNASWWIFCTWFTGTFQLSRWLLSRDWTWYQEACYFQARQPQRTKLPKASSSSLIKFHMLSIMMPAPTLCSKWFFYPIIMFQMRKLLFLPLTLASIFPQLVLRLQVLPTWSSWWTVD